MHVEATAVVGIATGYGARARAVHDGGRGVAVHLDDVAVRPLALGQVPVNRIAAQVEREALLAIDAQADVVIVGRDVILESDGARRRRVVEGRLELVPAADLDGRVAGRDVELAVALLQVRVVVVVGGEARLRAASSGEARGYGAGDVTRQDVQPGRRLAVRGERLLDGDDACLVQQDVPADGADVARDPRGALDAERGPGAEDSAAVSGGIVAGDGDVLEVQGRPSQEADAAAVAPGRVT